MQQFFFVKRLNRCMSSLHHLAAITILLLAGICPAQNAPAPNQQGARAFLQATDALSAKINLGINALEQIKDKASADAAVPVVLDIIAEHEKFRALVPDEQTLKQFWSHTPLYGSLRKMPAPIYNELLRQELKAGCHGSAKLAVAIAGKHGSFSEEQLSAPLSEQDAATLHQVEELVFTQIGLLKKEPKRTDAFLAAVDATQAGVEQLQQSPAGLMHWLALRERYREDIEQFYRCFYNGKLIERFFIQRATYMADFYSEHAHRYFFLFFREDRRDGEQMRRQLWADAAPRLAEFRTKNQLGGGDGRTPDTAFELPPNLTKSQRTEYINKVVREIFGEKHLTPAPHSEKMFVNTPGKYSLALRIPVIVGLLPEEGKDYYYPIIMTNVFFYTTEK